MDPDRAHHFPKHSLVRGVALIVRKAAQGLALGGSLAVGSAFGATAVAPALNGADPAGPTSGIGFLSIPNLEPSGLAPVAPIAWGRTQEGDDAAKPAPSESPLDDPEIKALIRRMGEISELFNEQAAAAALPEWRAFIEEVDLDEHQDDEIRWIFYLIGEIGVGTCLQEMGEWKASAEHLERILELENDFGPSYWANMHAIAAESYIIGGLMGLAKPHVKQGLALADLGLEEAKQAEVEGVSYAFNRAGFTEAYLTAAKFINNTPNFEPAEDILLRLLEVNFPKGQAQRAGAIGTAYRLLGTIRYRKYFDGKLDSDQPVLDTYQAALDMGEHLSPRDMFSTLTRMAHLHLEAKRLDLAGECLLRADTPEQIKSANVYDLAWFASLINRHVRESEGGSHPPFRNAWEDLLQHMRTTERVGGVGFFRVDRIREISFEAVMQGIREGGNEQGLVAIFESEQVGFLRGQLNPPMANLADLRRSLEPDSVCLIFSPGRERVHAFAVTRDDPVDHWIVEGGAALRAKVEEFSTSVFSIDALKPDSALLGSWQEASEVLKHALFPDNKIECVSRARRICFVGRERLFHPLFEMLVVEGRELGLTHAIQDWPSVGVGLFLHKNVLNAREKQTERASLQKSMPDPLDWLLIANPVLSETAREMVPSLTPLDMVFPTGDRIRVLQDTDATFGGWLQNSSAKVVQFLSHGVLKDSAEWSACIALTPDTHLPEGLLSGLDLLGQEAFLAPELAILTICKGQAGASRPGDPSAGRLPGALLAKGTRAVLTSRSDASVYLEPTKVFSRTLREQLAHGSRLDDAVLEARRAMALSTEHGQATHWSAWQVIGLGSLTLELSPSLLQTPSSSAPSIAMISGVLLLVLLLVGGFLLRRRTQA